MTRSVYEDDTLRALREQVSRFVEKKVVPHGERWEHDAMVPREVLREMGELGLLGIRYPERFGGSELDTLATAVFAEALSHSTFSGFNVTVLVHTDMASPHIARYGSAEQLDRYMPGIVAGDLPQAG